MDSPARLREVVRGLGMRRLGRLFGLHTVSPKSGNGECDIAQKRTISAGYCQTRFHQFPMNTGGHNGQGISIRKCAKPAKVSRLYRAKLATHTAGMSTMSCIFTP